MNQVKHDFFVFSLLIYAQSCWWTKFGITRKYLPAWSCRQLCHVTACQITSIYTLLTISANIHGNNSFHNLLSITRFVTTNLTISQRWGAEIKFMIWIFLLLAVSSMFLFFRGTCGSEERQDEGYRSVTIGCHKSHFTSMLRLAVAYRENAWNLSRRKPFVSLTLHVACDDAATPINWWIIDVRRQFSEISCRLLHNGFPLPSPDFRGFSIMGIKRYEKSICPVTHSGAHKNKIRSCPHFAKKNFMPKEIFQIKKTNNISLLSFPVFNYR